MTIEELLGKSANELEMISDAEALEYFKPYLIITRPDLATKNQPTKVTRNISSNDYNFNKKKAKAMEIAKRLGIELPL